MTLSLLAARVDGSAWYRFVLRHADRFLVFARRDARPPRPFPMTTETGERGCEFLDWLTLSCCHEGEAACPVTEWIDAVGAARVLNCRGNRCTERIARIIAGKVCRARFIRRRRKGLRSYRSCAGLDERRGCPSILSAAPLWAALSRRVLR